MSCLIFLCDNFTHPITFTFPCQNRYKDPTRGDQSYALMLAEKADAEEREANPKAGSEPGCPGCKN